MDLEVRVSDLLARGDSDGAATAALEALGPGVLGYLARLLPEAAAADAFEAFAERLWRELPGWRGGGSLRGWAYRVALEIAAHPAATQRRVKDDAGTRQRALEGLRESLDPEERTLLLPTDDDDDDGRG